MRKILQKSIRIFIHSISKPKDGRNSGMRCVKSWSSGLATVSGSFVSTIHTQNRLISGNGFSLMSGGRIRMFYFWLRPLPDRRLCIASPKLDLHKAIPILRGGLESRSWQSTSRKSPRLLLPTTSGQIFSRIHQTFFMRPFNVVGDQCLWSVWH